jgi:shingomyelin synthase
MMIQSLFPFYRWIVCRRVFVIVSMLYAMRSVTMYVTVLPLANTHVYCSPKINQSLSFGQTTLAVTKEVVKLVLAGGLPITGRKTMCGDYIYSGHTIVFMLTYLLIRECMSQCLFIIAYYINNSD